jgi:twitching motility protein PilI
MDAKPPETARLGKPAAPLAHTETFFGFRVGSLGFLVPASLHCEVIEQVQVNPLPNTQAWFGGLFNLRGNLIPVIDLHRLLGEESADPKKRRLFSIDKGEKAVALWIDGLPQVHGHDHEPLQQLPPLPAVLEPHVREGYLHQGQAWLNVRFGEFFMALGRQIALR